LLHRWLRAKGRVGGPPAPSPSVAHATARRFWQTCSNSFVTNPEYYETCERVLRSEILPRLGRSQRLLDVGCGNGRFTLVLAASARTVEGIDLYPNLIAEARATAAARSAKHVRFSVGDLTAYNPKRGAYDVVSCMGVISTIIDDWAFEGIVSGLRRGLKPGGWLLLRDSISREPAGHLVVQENYATRYRNEDAYKQAFFGQGLQLEFEMTLVSFGTSVNGLYLYQLPPR
jgi:2-polyprenyl-3-methyl-5-hydroxy-6-metoxy-1,4-benzoquinol methylase